jgi:hypothetical protein
MEEFSLSDGRLIHRSGKGETRLQMLMVKDLAGNTKGNRAVTCNRFLGEMLNDTTGSSRKVARTRRFLTGGTPPWIHRIAAGSGLATGQGRRISTQRAKGASKARMANAEP